MAKADEVGLQLVIAIAQAIHDLGEISRGKLYAIVMTKGISVSLYNTIVNKLVDLKLISISNHVLKWTGEDAEHNPNE